MIEDTPEAIAACLRAAALAADLVISSGGVSVGDYDFVRSCVESMGALTHYKVAMKPGKPVCFGHLDRRDGGRALFFGLPGNAVSSFVVMTELYLPVIQLLISGDDVEYPAQQLAIVDADIKKGASLALGFKLFVASTNAVVSSAGCNKDIPNPAFVGVTQGS